MKIRFVHARPDQQIVLEQECKAGTKAREAVVRCGMDQYFSDIDLSNIPIGIYGEKVDDNCVLVDQDRVELYRPLLMDPMEARRERAKRDQEKGTS